MRVVGITPLTDGAGQAIDPFDFDGEGGPWTPGTNLSARVAMPFFTSKPTDSARARAYDVTNDVIIDTMAAPTPTQLM